MHIQYTARGILTAFLLGAGALQAESPDDFFARASGKMAETTSIRSDFVQTKRLKAFRKPLKITGELCMDRTGRFAWHVKTPIRYSCVIAEGKLRQWDADTGKTLTLDVDSNPGLQYLARSLAGFFSGDFTEMKKDFEAVSVSDDGLSGKMRPRNGVPASSFIRSIRFFFEDDSLTALRRVVIDECSGDETDIEFLSSVRNQPVPEEKWRPDGN